MGRGRGGVHRGPALGDTPRRRRIDMGAATSHMPAMALTPDQLERYARHIVLKEIGGPGQQKLRAARVLLVGAGGLGAPAALYLAAAGVGAVGLADADAVSLSNLQRQVLFRTEDVGAPKPDAAAAALAALNPDVEVTAIPEAVTADNAEALIAGYDLVIEGVDSFASRYVVNDACYALERPLVSGAVGRWSGQVAVFKAGLSKNRRHQERWPCYRCLTPEPPAEAESCARAGIVGALTGIIGAAMALEAIKEITGAGETLAGRLMLYEGLSGAARTIALPADPHCTLCGASAESAA